MVSMSVIYKNNRLAPIIIITICTWISFILLTTYSKHSLEVEKAFTLTPIVSDAAKGSLLHTPGAQTPPAVGDGQETVLSGSQTGDTSLSPEDVLLIVKTGGTTIYKRLLIHLTTSLAPERIPSQNTVIYSDRPDKIGSFRVIDVLANTTRATLDTPEFEVYHAQPEYSANNVYIEAAGIDGDDSGPAGGWIIDKYKFVPLVQHAGKNWPHAKWYIYTEDDTYLFLPNVLKYLAKFKHTEAHWLGSYAAKSDVVFAHGGSGFALSRGAWEKSFGQDPNIPRDYEQYTAEHCCGDQVLGHALNKHGVKLGENGGDETFSYGWNGLVHWMHPFQKWNWCTPLYSWHKVHARDVVKYYEFEKDWKHAKPFTHGNFFMRVIAPDLERKREWWDNRSDKFKVTSANKDDPPMPDSVTAVVTWKEAWVSASTCAAACEAWDECMQWSFVEDLCKMDDRVIWGSGYAPRMWQRKTALKTTSGWMVKRLKEWDAYCDVIS